jgi:hypothetical protein
VFAISDFAEVAAAGTVLPPGRINATIDATLKRIGPAQGVALWARGHAIDTRKLLTVCVADVYACKWVFTVGRQGCHAGSNGKAIGTAGDCRLVWRVFAKAYVINQGLSVRPVAAPHP